MINEMMLALQSVKMFSGLNGKVVSRKEIENIIEIAKKENQTDIIYRLSKILNENPADKRFKVAEIENFTQPLNAPRHAGIYSEALDDCGRLRKGFKFENGTVVRVLSKKVGELKKKVADLKKKYGLKGSSELPEIKIGLNGSMTVDGYAVLSDEDEELYGQDENIGLNAAAKDVEQIINDLILDKINNGADLPPWKQSWASKTSILAQNFETKKEYTGSNATILNVLLGSIMPTPYYLTANQIEKMGGSIKKGAKSVPLVYYNFLYNLKDLSSNPVEENKLLAKINGYEVKRKGKKSIFLNKSNYSGVSLSQNQIDYLQIDNNHYTSRGFLLYYRVFNIADTEGIPYNLPAPSNKPLKDRIEIAEAIISGYKNAPKIKFGQKMATYDPRTDVIGMPNIEDFDPIEEYYTTIFHEMIHSTKIASRLDRDEKYKNKEKDAMYAFEEIIAELGACYLAGIAGIVDVVHVNSAAYLKGWHEKLQKHTNTYSDFFVFATREAHKAVDYILEGFVDPTTGGTEPKSTYSEREKAEAKAKALKLKLKLRLKLQNN